MSQTNTSPSSTSTPSTVTPAGNLRIIETLGVNLGTIAAVNTVTAPEITFSGLGTGIKAGDVILAISKPTSQAGLGIAGWRVDPSVDDKFYITFVNPTAGNITPTASETYSITVARLSSLSPISTVS